jgi:hypothetical protein
MNPGEIYAKTEQGTRELKERNLSLPISLRSLLIMIDGNRTVAEVLDRARPLHVDTMAMLELERAGLIAKRFDAPSSNKAPAGPAPRSEDHVKRFLDAQQLMSNTLSEHLGFRGYLMMMRLQRAESLRDLHDLVPDFSAALVKRAGAGVAAPIMAELKRLIVGSE